MFYLMIIRNMDSRIKLKWCLICNFILLILFLTVLEVFESSNTYWNFGPNPNLTVISVHIDTWYKYSSLLSLVALFNISQVTISEIAHPILHFSIYNPDKKIITEFTQNELQFYANSMYMIDAIRNVLMLMITISQLDIAIFGAIISEITGIFTVKKLLDEKIFDTPDSVYEIV